MKRAAIILVLLIMSLMAFASCREQEEDVSYVVRFDVSYLSYTASVPESVTVTAGSRVEEPEMESAPTAGYVTIWTRTPSAPVAYDFSQGVTEDVTLYAVETPKTYKIRYIVEKGQNSSRNVSEYDKTQEVELFAPVSIPFGYRFKKWSYFDDPDSEVTHIERGTQGDIVLRAVYFPVEYTVQYKDVDGAVNANPKKYVFGETLVLTPLEREGYTFLGFTAQNAPSLVVTELTGEFVAAHVDELFNSNYIYLKANWRELS